MLRLPVRTLALSLCFALQASLAVAQSFEQQLSARLSDEGYTRIVSTRTLLGRVRIIAEGPQGEREIVLNPRTGAILRDYLDDEDEEGDEDELDSEDHEEDDSDRGADISPGDEDGDEDEDEEDDEDAGDDDDEGDTE